MTTAHIQLAVSGLALLCPLTAQDPPTQEETREAVMNSPIRSTGGAHEGDRSFTIEKDPSVSTIDVSVVFHEKPVGSVQLTDSAPTATVFLPTILESGDDIDLLESHSGRLLLQVTALPLRHVRGNVVHTGAYGSTTPGADDVVFLFEYLNGTGPAPMNTTAADVDGDGDIDVDDLLVLYYHVIGQPYYTLEGEFVIQNRPVQDLRTDGTTVPVNTSHNEIGLGWAKSHTPPQKGEPVLEFDEDGNPKTKEWLYPCTFRERETPAGGTGYYFTRAISRGPRTPVPDTELTSTNCTHTLYYYCWDTLPVFPFFEVNRYPIGQCRYANSGNYMKVLDDGTLFYQCQNETPNNDQKTDYYFNPNFFTITVVVDGDLGNAWNGPAGSWPGWAPGT